MFINAYISILKISPDKIYYIYIYIYIYPTH